jgi:hypothetical protein
MITSKPANGRTQDISCCTAPTGVLARTFLVSSAEKFISTVEKFPRPVQVLLDCFGWGVQHENQPVKRRRAMLESNPPRNSRWQTHQDDEAGGRGGRLLRPLAQRKNKSD